MKAKLMSVPVGIEPTQILRTRQVSDFRLQISDRRLQLGSARFQNLRMSNFCSQFGS